MHAHIKSVVRTIRLIILKLRNVYLRLFHILHKLIDLPCLAIVNFVFGSTKSVNSLTESLDISLTLHKLSIKCG